MEKEEYENMFSIEDNYWWFFGRNYIISTLFKEYRFDPQNLKILNAGCGTGGLFKFLSKYSENYFGMDISGNALFFSKKRNISNLCKGDILHIPFKDESFSIIFVLDVMEHLDNDIRAIHEIFRILKKNGFCFITVPSYAFLWSEHDEILGHKRRYNLKELERKLIISKFSIIKKGYFVFFVFPFIFLFRLLNKKKHTKNKRVNYKIPRPVNQFLLFLARIELIIIKNIRLPFGLTIFFTIKK